MTIKSTEEFLGLLHQGYRKGLFILAKDNEDEESLSCEVCRINMSYDDMLDIIFALYEEHIRSRN